MSGGQGRLPHNTSVPHDTKHTSESKCQLLNVRSFEVDRDDSILDSAGVSGHLSTEEDSATFEALKELCQKENVDKVMIVYRNYTFTLVGVSFTDTNSNPPSVTLKGERNYNFKARDVYLDALTAKHRINEANLRMRLNSSI